MKAKDLGLKEHTYYLDPVSDCIMISEAWALESAVKQVQSFIEVREVRRPVEFSDEGKKAAIRWLGRTVKPKQLVDLDAWLDEMLAQAEGFDPGVDDRSYEVRSWDAISGHTELYTFSEEDFVWESDWIEA